MTQRYVDKNDDLNVDKIAWAAGRSSDVDKYDVANSSHLSKELTRYLKSYKFSSSRLVPESRVTHLTHAAEVALCLGHLLIPMDKDRLQIWRISQSA